MAVALVLIAVLPIDALNEAVQPPAEPALNATQPSAALALNEAV